MAHNLRVKAVRRVCAVGEGCSKLMVKEGW